MTVKIKCNVGTLIFGDCVLSHGENVVDDETAESMARSASLVDSGIIEFIDTFEPMDAPEPDVSSMTVRAIREGISHDEWALSTLESMLIDERKNASRKGVVERLEGAIDSAKSDEGPVAISETP